MWEKTNEKKGRYHGHRTRVCGQKNGRAYAALREQSFIFAFSSISFFSFFFFFLFPRFVSHSNFRAITAPHHSILLFPVRYDRWFSKKEVHRPYSPHPLHVRANVLSRVYSRVPRRKSNALSQCSARRYRNNRRRHTLIKRTHHTHGFRQSRNMNTVTRRLIQHRVVIHDRHKLETTQHTFVYIRLYMYIYKYIFFILFIL